jgi:hypothetical protein
MMSEHTKSTERRKNRRRAEIERRELTYDMYFPEKRSGNDRRVMFDRRHQEQSV